MSDRIPLECTMPFKVTLTESNEQTGLMKVRGIMQKYDVVNSNGRVYPKSLFEKILKDSMVQERIKNRGMVGVLEHPDDGQTRLENISHVVTKVWDDGKGNILGECEVLETKPGTHLKRLFEGNVMVGISSRGSGSVVSKDGVSYVNEDDYELETWDFVYNNSVPGANPVPVTESTDAKNKVDEETHVSVNDKEDFSMADKLAEMKTLRRQVGSLCDSKIDGASFEKKADLAESCDDLQVKISKLIAEDASLTSLGTRLQERLADFSKSIEEHDGAELENLQKKYDALSEMYEGVVEQFNTLKATLEEGSKPEKDGEALAEAQKRYDALKKVCEELVKRVRGANKIAESSIKKLKAKRVESGLTKRYTASKQIIEGLVARYHGDTIKLFKESILMKYPEAKKYAGHFKKVTTFTEAVELGKKIVKQLQKNESAATDHSGKDHQKKDGDNKVKDVKVNESTTRASKTRREPLPKDKLHESKTTDGADELHESVSLVRRSRQAKVKIED